MLFLFCSAFDYGRLPISRLLDEYTMRFLLILVAGLLTAPAFAIEWRDNSAIQQLFINAGVNGTFVLYDVNAKTLTGHNRTRAQTRYIPASTFKIPNSLIGLSAGTVKSVDEILPYGGKPQPFKQWENDMGLREAIKISNVPIYQELARRTGLQPMQEDLTRLQYGNGEIGTVVDRFWLDGPLQISAVEQTQFLAQLAQEKLPFPVKAQKDVKAITLLETNAQGELHGKTGWLTSTKPQVGWWVGWVEKQGRVYAFALNMDIRSETDLEKRVALGKAGLKALVVM